jgi:hypothetical protein
MNPWAQQGGPHVAISAQNSAFWNAQYWNAQYLLINATSQPEPIA